jgi:mono/diheme cytochrome c family protein
MRWYIAVTVFLVVATAPRSGAAAEQPPAAGPERDIGAEVRAVFAARCAGCHGPDLPKPKGRFGYVLDLRRMADNPELVIPGRPDESELWALVRHGDMPPADSPHGPLTAAEKEVIRAWIVAGTPDARHPASGASFAPDPPIASPVPRAVRWLGRFHLLLLHFPIALVLAAGVGELASAWRGSRVPSPAVQFCLSLAAVAAVPTVALGWLHAATGSGVGSPQLLAAHRWVGTAAGVWVIGTALGARRDARRGVRSRGVRVALVAVGVPLIVAAAHVGGLMAHGRDFLDW